MDMLYQLVCIRTYRNVSTRTHLRETQRASELNIPTAQDRRAPVPSSVYLYMAQNNAVAAYTASLDRNRMSICLQYLG
jgi:hypothetical protein